VSEATGYKTKQRENILKLLKENNGVHMTAEDVFEYLKTKGNSVGKSTVYRYLDKLVNEGKVKKFFVDEGVSACYQYYSKDCEFEVHYHLKCSQCGGLFHVDCHFLDDLSKHILNTHNFKIDCNKIVLYGECEACSLNNI